MKPVSFRIKNYKSIADSGVCYFSEGVTILAGKNESGKTATLEALAAFHENQSILESAKPIFSNIDPSVEVNFEIDTDDLIFEARDLGLDLPLKPKEKAVIGLVKKMQDDMYELSRDTKINLRLLSSLEILRSEINEHLSHLKVKRKNLFNSAESLSNFEKRFSRIRTSIEPTADEEMSLAAIEAELERYKNEAGVEQKLVNSLVEGYLPYFIFVSLGIEEFPDSIAVSDLAVNEWAIDLEQVSGFSIENFMNDNVQARTNHQLQVNQDFSVTFEKYWTQDPIKLVVEHNGDNIFFWIEENGIRFMPSQRSLGQRWFLGFYVKVVARLSEKKPNVILIDEPGLHLHAQAQKDLLRVLESHASDTPIIFSTHSPYLITSENMESIRLVEKANNKTVILGKPHAHVTAARETLAPILTAIGLGMNDSITNLDQRNNIVVEGIEDVFYLQSFKLLLPEDERPALNFISGGGSGNMGIVGAVLEGWGCNVAYLLDSDQGGKDGNVCLSRTWSVPPQVIHFAMNDGDGSLSDILTKVDFATYVLDEPNKTFASSNSGYLLKSKRDKILHARQFLQRVKAGEVQLSNESMVKIRELFSRITLTE